MKSPLMSVIILNWNRKNDVSETLARLRLQTFKNFETLVVDNASNDGSVSYFRKNFPETKVLPLKKNYALFGFNLAMEKARGKYFLHLASDAMLANNVIEKHIKKLEANPNLGVSCATTYEWRTKRYLAPNRAIKGDNKRGYKVTYFDGNGICLRREVFEKVGGYTQDYFICLEELEWAVRILESGFDIRCFTDIIVYNKKSEKGGSQRSKYGFFYCRNWVWFYTRYLPLREIPKFLNLHIKSFFRETGPKGSMKKTQCFEGIMAGIKGVPKFLRERTPLSRNTVERVKNDLFPGRGHLYIG